MKVIELPSQEIVKTKNLILRKFNLDDTERIFILSQEDDIRQWLPDQVYKNLQEAKEVLNFLISQYNGTPDPYHNPYVLAIEAKSTGELIGHIGLSPIKNDEVEIGYGIAEAFQNKGFATEAVQNFSEWSISNIEELDVIWGIVKKGNEASVKVLEKSHYKYFNQEEDRLKYIYRSNNSYD